MHKQKFKEGEFTPMEFVQAISHTIGKITMDDSYLSSDLEYSVNESPNTGNICLTSLSPQATTLIFVMSPCKLLYKL